MSTKKRVSLFCLAIFFLTISSFVLTSAQVPGQDPVADAFVSLQNNGVVRFILGDFGTTSTSELFFIKILVFFLLILIVNYAVEQVPTLGARASVRTLISIIVSLIAVRYLTSATLVNFIWLPYGVLGVFLASVVPFVLGYYFIESFQSGAFRKVAWSLYVVVFAGLAFFRWDSLAFNFVSTKEYWFENLGSIYILTAILSFLLMIFDRSIRAVMFRSQIKSVVGTANRAQAAKVQRRINELYDDLAHSTGAAAAAAIKAQIKAEEATLQNLIK